MVQKTVQVSCTDATSTLYGGYKYVVRTVQVPCTDRTKNG